MIRPTAVLAALTALPVLAADVPDVPAKAGPTLDLLHWLGSFAIVMLALFLLIWLLRRAGSFSRLSAEAFRVIAAIPVGTRERVVVVKVGDRQLVLGVAPGSVQTLLVLEGDAVLPEHSGRQAKDGFAASLAALMEGSSADKRTGNLVRPASADGNRREDPS